MQTLAFTDLPKDDQSILKEAVSRLSHSLNKVSNPQISAIAVTKKGKYYGNNIFLSNCALFCAEATALAASAAAKDSQVLKLYFASGRADSQNPKLISPCCNCRQILHDFARLNQEPIELFLTTSTLEEVVITSSEELLPGGFKSASLGKMAGENNS